LCDLKHGFAGHLACRQGQTHLRDQEDNLIATMTKVEKTDHDAIRQQLETRAQQLRAELLLLRADRDDDQDGLGRDTVPDAGEQGDQISRDEVRRAEQERDANELRDITAALQRMDEGRYGECRDCGGDIAPSRLQVQPSALRCIKCQERYEQSPAATLGGGAS
jgi:RNA polymerase-binding transcription factor DksA